MNQQLRPTLNLTQSEEIFFMLIKHEKYKDNRELYKNLIKYKKDFLKEKINEIEEKVYHSKLLDSIREMSNDKYDIGQSFTSEKLEQKSQNLRESFKLNRSFSFKEIEKSVLENLSNSYQGDKSRSHSFSALNRSQSQRITTKNGPKPERKDNKRNKKNNKMIKKKLDLIYISFDGQYKRRKARLKGSNIFSDLNYGDVSLVFPNPLYDFMIKEREVYDDYVFNFEMIRKSQGDNTGKMNKEKLEKLKEIEEQRQIEKEKKTKELKEQAYLSMGFIRESMVEKKNIPEYMFEEKFQKMNLNAAKKKMKNVIKSSKTKVDDKIEHELKKVSIKSVASSYISSEDSSSSFESEVAQASSKNSGRKLESIDIALGDISNLKEAEGKNTVLSYRPRIRRKVDNTRKRVKRNNTNLFQEIVEKVKIINAPGIIIQKQRTKLLGNRKFITFNHVDYGRSSKAKPHEMKLKEAIDVFKKTINIVTELESLSKEYLLAEEVGFINALIFYSKENYYNRYYESNILHYHHEVNPKQMPFSAYVFPHLKRLFFLNEFEESFQEDFKGKRVGRFRYTFLFNIDKYLFAIANHLVIDKRIFQLLLRKIILLKLNKVGFYTREFYGEDMKKIFVVLKAQKNLIKKRAARIKYPTQVELSFSDLFSLMPVDSHLRPFNLKTPTFKQFEDYVNTKLDEEGIGQKESRREKFAKISEDDEFTRRNIKKKDLFEGERTKEEIEEDFEPKSLNPREIVQVIKNKNKLSDLRFRKIMGKKQKEIRKFLKELKIFLKYPSEIKSAIIDDKICSRWEWTKYTIFFSIILKSKQHLKFLLKKFLTESVSGIFEATSKFTHRIPEDRKINLNLFLKLATLNLIGNECAGAESIKQILSVFWRVSFLKSLNASNKGFNDYKRNFLHKIFCMKKYNGKHLKSKELKTIWDYYNYKPTKPYLYYQADQNADGLWRTYQINELKDRSIFRTMDRLKIIDNLISKSFNVYKLLDLGDNLILDYTALHNHYELEHRSKISLFGEFKDVIQSCKRPDMGEVYNYIKSLSKKNSVMDFLSVPLNNILKINLCSPIQFDISPIYSYFGERVAMYFLFLRFFTQYLKPIVVIGIIFYFLEIEFENREIATESEDEKLKIRRLGHLLRVFFGVCVMMWNSLTVDFWKREENHFAIYYGVYDEETANRQRPSFTGKFFRDLASSEPNVLKYPAFKTKLKQMFSLFLSFLIVCLSILSSLAILAFKNELNEKGSILVNFLPATLNVIATQIFTRVYDMLKKKLNKLENHRTSQEYENSMIIKVFLFNFFNYFNSFFVIAFIKPNTTLLGKCSALPSNSPIIGPNGEPLLCAMELRGFVRTHFIILFLTNFLEIIVPTLIKMFVKKKLKVRREYPWGKVDRLIENEYEMRNPYRLTVEIDGVIQEYLEVVLLFSFISMFGVLNPIGFTFALMTMICEIFIDKYKMIYLVRRPIPQSVKNIGAWEFILHFVSYVSIIVNCMLLAFTTRSFGTIYVWFTHFDFSITTRGIILVNSRIFIFAGICVFFIYLKKFLQAVIQDVPRELMDLRLREYKIANLKLKKMINRGSSKIARSGLLVGRWKEEDYSKIVNYKKEYN